MNDRQIINEAVSRYGSDEVDVLDITPDRVDGGAWVQALVWVPIDDDGEPEVVTRWASKVVQDAAWLAARAAEVWPVAVGAEGRLAVAGGELTPRGAAVRSALRTALALEAEGATVRAARQLWRALDAARA